MTQAPDFRGFLFLEVAKTGKDGQAGASKFDGIGNGAVPTWYHWFIQMPCCFASLKHGMAFA